MAVSKRELRALLGQFEDAFTGNADVAEVRQWLPRLRGALEQSYPSDARIADEVVRILGLRWRNGLKGLDRRHRLPIARIGPAVISERYRPLLAERIRASAELIKINRDEEIAHQLRRFAGWATGSVPGQAKRSDRGELSKGVTKSLQQESFTRRRMLIDQGAKLIASVDEAISAEHGAIAKKWRHVIPHAGYESRPEHLERDGKVYAVKGNEMLAARRMKKGGRPYAEDLEDQPSAPPYCRCWWESIYDLEDLPADMRV